MFFWFKCLIASKSGSDGRWMFLSRSAPPLCLYAGTNPSRPGGFPGANSPGPVADLYGPSSQDSAVGNYISAASPQPGSGFGPSITVSTLMQTLCRVWTHLELSCRLVCVITVPPRLDTKPMHTGYMLVELTNYMTLYSSTKLITITITCLDVSTK